MNYFWKDIEEPKGSWQGLAVKVEDAAKPQVKLQSGNNGRIKLSINNTPVFWATISEDYYGVWVYKSFQKIALEEMIIPPITSADVEEFHSLDGVERDKAWCKYFFKKLERSSSSFLHDGLWYMNAYKNLGQKLWSFDTVNKKKRPYYSKIDNAKEAFDAEQVEYVKWEFCESNALITLKRVPHEDEGRVKWWRKKVKEGTVPPILVWHLTCLDAFVIIDGHARLYASILENKAPHIISIYSGIEYKYEVDMNRQKAIVNSVQNRGLNKPLSVEKINELLISAFDDRPYIQSRTRSVAEPEFEVLWEKEVTDELTRLNLKDDLDGMLTRF